MANMTIMGAGIFGLSVAWTALQRGANVRVYDPNGVGSGASGGLVGALQPHTPDPWNVKKQFQFESLVQAQTFWAQVDAASGQSSGYARVGRLQPLMKDRDIALAQSRTAAARENWGDDWDWQVTDKVDAWHPPSPTGQFVWDTFSAILHPRQATQSLAAAVIAKGGEIVATGAPDGPVIWATGWRGLVENGYGTGIKGQAALLAHDAAGAPQIFADGVHIVPHLDGTVAIGSTSERDFETPHQTDDQLDALIQKARDLMPVLADAPVLEKWAGVRPRAASRAPLLGPVPDHPGQFIANGGFKIGFGMAPKCADVLVDLILDGKNNIPDEFHTLSQATDT